MQKRKRGTDGIVKISNLFQKYATILKAPQGTVIKNFIEVIQEIFGVTLRPDQCAYSVTSRTLTVRISGTIKTEITLQKKKIFSMMEERLGEKSTIKEIL